MIRHHFKAVITIAATTGPEIATFGSSTVASVTHGDSPTATEVATAASFRQTVDNVDRYFSITTVSTFDITAVDGSSAIAA